MKKIVLTAINSKYIHSNLAVYCLRQVAGVYKDAIHIKEYSINNQLEMILRDLYESTPDVLCFSCYIWNISMVKKLLVELHKILPETDVWLGGPEVTYQAESFVRNYPNVKGVMRGEGELSFFAMTQAYVSDRSQDLLNIPGTTIRTEAGVVSHPDSIAFDFHNSPIPYDLRGAEAEAFSNRIIYYESSRGCPFSCSYCLSCVDKALRFKKMDIVERDLADFLALRVPQVKFVDRTFNCNRTHALAVWNYIKDHDNGVTNFHFEIAADILTEEEIRVLQTMRPGLVQLEVGVQTTNPVTVEAINRSMDIQILEKNVRALNEGKNIHLHLDLIAGLPYEDYESFGRSFDQVYGMKPEQLQLGFLKLLHGSPIREQKELYGIVVNEEPPYEVLYTKWLSYGDVIRLKQTEHVVDMFYNSAMFANSLKYLEGFFQGPFAMYEQLGVYYDACYHNGELPSRNGKYDLLRSFACNHMETEEWTIFNELLRYDMYKRENVKSLPEYMKQRQLLNFYDGRKLTRAEHIEQFQIDVLHYEETGTVLLTDTLVHFDYQNRDSLLNNAFTKTL